MLKTYSLDEMLEIWKQNLGILEDDCGCIVTRHDGDSLHKLLIRNIRSWYATLLRTKNPALLPIEDLHSEADVSIESDNCLAITPPRRGVRLLSVKLTDWDIHLGTVAAADSDVARLQASHHFAATPRRPVAIFLGSRYLLYGLKTDITYIKNPALLLESLIMVAAPSDSDTFTLDESLLSTIPTKL